MYIIWIDHLCYIITLLCICNQTTYPLIILHYCIAETDSTQVSIHFIHRNKGPLFCKFEWILVQVDAIQVSSLIISISFSIFTFFTVIPSLFLSYYGCIGCPIQSFFLFWIHFCFYPHFSYIIFYSLFIPFLFLSCAILSVLCISRSCTFTHSNLLCFYLRFFGPHGFSSCYALAFYLVLFWA